MSSPKTKPITQPGQEGNCTHPITKPIARRLVKAPSSAVALSGNDIGSISPTSTAPNTRPQIRPRRAFDILEVLSEPAPPRKLQRQPHKATTKVRKVNHPVRHSYDAGATHKRETRATLRRDGRDRGALERGAAGWESLSYFETAAADLPCVGRDRLAPRSCCVGSWAPKLFPKGMAIPAEEELFSRHRLATLAPEKDFLGSKGPLQPSKNFFSAPVVHFCPRKSFSRPMLATSTQEKVFSASCCPLPPKKYFFSPRVAHFDRRKTFFRPVLATSPRKKVFCPMLASLPQEKVFPASRGVEEPPRHPDHDQSFPPEGAMGSASAPRSSRPAGSSGKRGKLTRLFPLPTRAETARTDVLADLARAPDLPATIRS